MELIKKIIVSVLTLVGIALAALIICAGVLVVFPDTKIFGVSYINTTNKNPIMSTVNDIDIDALKDVYTVEILAGDYNVELTQNTGDLEYVKAELKNNVVGFTKEMDSNKEAKLDVKYDDATSKLTFTVSEPSGLFLKRDTVLKISFPAQMLDKKVNVISKTNKGITTFGTSETPLKVNDVTASCDSAKGGVELDDALIGGDLYIKNILGRINVKNEIKGVVTIDSTIGTYTFNKINDLVVVAGDDGKTNNPAITLNECRNVNWTSDSGSLVVRNCVIGDIDATTKNANFNIAKTIGAVKIEGTNANVDIAQVGNFVEDSTSEYNSYNWKDASKDISNTRVVMIANSDSGNINIGRSYFELALSTSKGKVDVKNAMRKVDVETKSGSINVEFVDGENTITSNELDTYIVNHFTTYLDSTEKIESLIVKTVDGPVNVTNIRNSIKIEAESAPITLTYKKVKNASDIKTSSKAVTVKAKTNDFKLITKMDKKSSAVLEINFEQLVMKTYNDDLPDTTRMKKYEEDNYKCLEVKVNNAADSTINVITIINTTGKISASSY